MLGIKVDRIGRGAHSSEVIVSVSTADGAREELVVDERSVENDMLEVGYPVGAREKAYLVELPRETVRGSWRIWVSKDALKKVNGEALA